MIVYDVVCGRGHRFEGWFKDSAAFDAQRAAGAIPCPACGNVDVSKAITAPHVARRSATDSHPSSPADVADNPVAALAAAARELRKHIEATCENVGAAFPEEARRIHYGETEQRDIYGTADAATARELRDEGIAIEALPFPLKRDH